MNKDEREEEEEEEEEEESTLLRELVAAGESLATSVARAEEKLATQRVANDRLRTIVEQLATVAREREREAREMEVKVAEMKLKTSLGEMRAEATTRAEKMRDVELAAWLKRDDKRTLESREKRRKDHAEDAESGARATTSSFLEDEEEKEKEETPLHVEEEDERWLRRAREKVREATARYRVEFVERETTKVVVLKKTTTKVRTKTQRDKMFLLEEEEDSSTK